MSKTKVLIVEDEPLIARDVKNMLEAKSFEVLDILFTGEDAIAKANELGPDLILTDIVLQGEIDGITAIEEIRTKHDIPFIFMTGHSDKKTLSRAKATEPHGYILKPVTKRELYSTIEIALHKHEMEVKLKESEERYRAVLQDIPMLICRFLPGGEISYVNENYCRYFGTTAGKLIGKSFLPLIPESDRDKVMASLSALTVESPTQSHEHQVIMANKEIRWQRWVNRALFDNLGRIIAYQATGEDISERKLAETEIKEVYRIINMSPVTVFLRKNVEGWPVEFVTENVDNLFGYGSEQFISNDISYEKLIHPDDLESVYGKVLENGRKGIDDFEHEPYRIIAKDGTVKWIKDVTNIRRDGDGNITHYQGIVLDITRLKITENKLSDKSIKLNERVKELNCLYGILSIVGEHGSTLDDILQGTVNLIPPSWQYPEITCAQINVSDQRFYSDNFRESKWRLSGNIFSCGIKTGQVDVFLTEKRPDIDGGEGPFLIEERSLIDVISEHLGKIVERIELKKEILDISERERIRIGHDLHDGVGQDLTGVSYLFRAAMDKLSNNEFPEEDEVEMIMNLINETKTHVRMLSRGLSPVDIESNGITIAVKDLCRRAEKIFDIQCILDYDDININDNTIATHLFYIIQESLNNAVKHGKAKNIRVALNKTKGKVSLLIEDDGIGFQKKPSEEKGLGLELLRYRSDIIGAKLKVSERKPTGVVISCLLDR